MKPAAGSRFGRNRFRVVYVNCFGSHRCGNVIRYGGGHLRPEGRAALADMGSRALGKALSPISKRMGSGPAALPPSPKGQESPCFAPGATSKVQAEGAGRGGSQPPHRERQAKSTEVPGAKEIMTEPPCAPDKGRSCKRAAASSTATSSQKQTGGCQVTQGGVFEFPAPLENANNVIRKHREKSAVWHGVSKVISKMIEENRHFQNRLVHCSQLSSEGSDINDDAVNGASCIDTGEAIFGWM